MMKDKTDRIEEVEEAEEKNHKGPLKIILGLFLVFLMVLWLVPHYGLKQNPEPDYLPSLKELDLKTFIVPEITSTQIKDYIQIDSEIKQAADKIVSLSCKETSKICNAKAIFYFVQGNFNYLNDPLSFEYYKTPHESLHSNNGDCDDGSILLSSLLQSIGFRTRFVFVPGHVYIQVNIPEAVSSYKDEDGWINLDSTCDGCSFGEINYGYRDSKKTYLE